jgi:hypothetical protein
MAGTDTLDSQSVALRLERLERHNHTLRQAGGLALLLVASLLLMGQSACLPERSKQTPAPAPMVQQPYQRFVRIASFPAGQLNWALDTKTGQVCRTWDWQVVGEKPNPKGLQIDLSTPTCLELYKADAADTR